MTTKDEIALNGRHLIAGQGSNTPDAALEARHRERRVRTEMEFDQIRQVNSQNKAVWKTECEAEEQRRRRV
jgi:hypothetical protein